MALSLYVYGVNETTASIGYNASLDITGVVVTSIYGNIGGVNISRDGNQSVWVSGLGEKEQTIEGSITYKYEWSEWVGPGANDYKTHSGEKRYEASVNVFTHPGEWFWEDKIKENDIIQQALTADLVNEWVDHLAAWKSWKEQWDWYSAYNDYYNPNNGRGYRVNSNDIIYLQWFNNCAEAHPNKPLISHQNNEDIISIETFKTLNFNGTGPNT